MNPLHALEMALAAIKQTGISGIMGLTLEEEAEALRLLEAGRWTQ